MALVNLVGNDGVVGEIYDEFVGLMIYTGYNKGSALWDFGGGVVAEP